MLQHNIAMPYKNIYFIEVFSKQRIDQIKRSFQQPKPVEHYEILYCIQIIIKIYLYKCRAIYVL